VAAVGLHATSIHEATLARIPPSGALGTPPLGLGTTAFLMSSHKIEAGDLRDRPKHRSSCSTVEEDLAAATVMDGSALPAIDVLASYDAISKAPRAAGYRGSDFGQWHRAPVRGGAAIPSAM
jgi:hypothetical protein